METCLSLPSNSEENNDIDDFFDNIPENEDDFTSLFAEIASINKAKELLVSNSDRTDSDDSENTDCETSSIADESTEVEDEVEIPQINSSNLTPCALIDTINGSIQRCGETKDLRGLAQLIGTWQIDSNAVCEAGSNLENLGVCFSHFAFDQNRLHKKNAKKEQNIELSFLHRRRCLFCGLNINFFSHGKFCYEHSVFLGNKNLLAPCIGYKHYKLMNQLLLSQNYNKNHGIYVVVALKKMGDICM